jgi:glucose-6-phosphate isomerase
VNRVSVKSPAIVSRFDSGLDIKFLKNPMAFEYGPGIFGPRPEYRSLDAIRASLRDPQCFGPDPVYAIAMDVGREEDRAELQRRMLLFGIVIYAAGRLGEEPVRSQGHVHAIAPHCGWSTPEIFEIWEGRAVVYAQQNSGDDPGVCLAIHARPGDRVVMPPGWAHFVANADPKAELVFGAWCDRQYGFDYTQMRAHHGLAWYPVLESSGDTAWKANPAYATSRIETRTAREYPELGLASGTTIYELFRRDPELVQWVSDPARLRDLWPAFQP